MFPGRGRGSTAAVAARGGDGSEDVIFVKDIAYVDDGTFSVKFTQEQLQHGPLHSEPMRIGCVQWSLTLSPQATDTPDATNIDVTFNCLQNANALDNFRCHTQMTIRLVPTVPEPDTATARPREIPAVSFNAQNLERTYNAFTNTRILRDIADKFADAEGRYAIEVRIQIKKVDYDLFPENEFDQDGDVVIIAGDRRFSVDKKYLSMHASYFGALFGEAFNEAGKNEVTLEDVDPQDFLQFLRAIYPSAKNAVVGADNVEALVVLADKFAAPALSAKCQEYLRSNESDEEISDCDKLKLAELGNLSLVKTHVMKRVLRMPDLDQIITSFKWSDDTLQMLLRKKKSIENSVSGHLRIL